MLALDHQHVPAVALGDDLILEILRRVLAAQIRLERAAQPRALLAQALADHFQLRARVVEHIAGRIDLVARLGDLALERRRSRARLVEQRKGRGDRPDRGSRLFHRLEERRQLQQLDRFERPPFDDERAEDPREAGTRGERELTLFRDERHRLAGRGQQLGNLLRIGRRLEPRQALVAHRRRREATDRFDDPIELERPQNGWMHQLETAKPPRARGGESPILSRWGLRARAQARAKGATTDSAL